MPWELVLRRYEFMIALASFRCNMYLYFEMDRGQLRTTYGQIVSFSPARILCADALVSHYKLRAGQPRAPRGDEPREGRPHPLNPVSPLRVPTELSEAVTLALGNAVPKRFVHECISGYTWRGYERLGRCVCGVWPQALELISCFVPDAETSLSLQDETRVSAYIRTLMDVHLDPGRGKRTAPLRNTDMCLVIFWCRV